MWWIWRAGWRARITAGRCHESIKGDQDAQAVFGIVGPVLKTVANGGASDDDAADIARG